MKYPTELVVLGAWLVFESGSPIAYIVADFGIPTETSRKCVRRVEVRFHERGDRS